MVSLQRGLSGSSEYQTYGRRPLKHAGNGGQIWCEYKYLGWRWHGCPRCYPDRVQSSKVHHNRTFQELYNLTLAKLDNLADHGYNLEVIWECIWDTEVKTKPDLQTFLQDLDLVEPLNLHHYFFAGRTNAIMMHHKVNTSLGEQICYVDVTSLYPWVNKTALYPVGHPMILTDVDHRHLTVLLHRQSGRASTRKPIPSHITSASLPLSLVHGDWDGQTHGWALLWLQP